MTDGWCYRLSGEEVHDLALGKLTLGRSRKCDVSVSDPSVSRKHVSLTVGSGRVRLEDLGSSNGTFVNGRRVEREIELHHGDRLRLGDANLLVEIQPRPGRPSAAPPPLRPAEVETEVSSVSGHPLERGSDVATLAPPMAELPRVPAAAPIDPDDVILTDEAPTMVGGRVPSFVRDDPESDVRASVEEKATAPSKIPRPQPAAPQPAATDREEPDPSPARGTLLPSLDDISSVGSLGPDLSDIPGTDGRVEPSPPPEDDEEPSMLRRLGAALLDVIWIGALGLAAFALAGWTAALVVMALALVVNVVVINRLGITPGQQLMGLSRPVTDRRGD